jgi:hypothetical protein
LSEKYLAAVFFGYGVGSIIINVMRGICLMMFTQQGSLESILIYYVVSAFLFLAAAGLYLIEGKNEFVIYKIAHAN